MLFREAEFTHLFRAYTGFACAYGRYVRVCKHFTKYHVSKNIHPRYNNIQAHARTSAHM